MNANTTSGYSDDVSGLGVATGYAGTALDRTDGSHTPLISADKVKGTIVYNANEERLGSIDSVMIDKQSGKVAYAVMSFGGFLGIGEKYHPLPWDGLTYDEGVGGYRVNLTRESLEGAPSYDRDTVDSFDYGRDAGGIDDYYGRQTGFYSDDAQARRNAQTSGLNADDRDRDSSWVR